MKKNNPFEQGYRQSSNIQPPSFRKVLIFITKIVVVCAVMFFIFINFNNIFTANKSYTYGETDYQYNASDYQWIKSTDQELFPLVPSGGQALYIDIDNSDFDLTNNGYELKYIVGYDIEPGVYTIEVNGDSDRLNFDTAVGGFLYLSDATFYNVPLLEGDIFEITHSLDNTDFSYKFTPQTSYKNYEIGLSGVFVYGLSNFHEQIYLAEDDYQLVLYNHSRVEYYDNENAFIESEPGSYFTIDSTRP